MESVILTVCCTTNYANDRLPGKTSTARNVSKKEPFYVCPLDRNMLTLIVMVMMENDCHDYHPLPMLTLLLMEIRASLVHHHHLQEVMLT